MIVIVGYVVSCIFKRVSNLFLQLHALNTAFFSLQILVQMAMVCDGVCVLCCDIEICFAVCIRVCIPCVYAVSVLRACMRV